MVRIDVGSINLLDEICHVIGQPEKVLLIFVVQARLAGDCELGRAVEITKRAVALDGKHVTVRDAVVEHDPSHDAELVRFLRQVV